MSEKRFNIVFFGITQPGRDRDEAIVNMAQLFKTEPAKIKPLFAGGRQVIKGNVDDLMAEKYRDALENAGLVVKIEEAEETPATASPAAAGAPAQSQVKIDTGDISMAEVGSDVLVNPVEVAPQPIGDISDLNMAETGADLVTNSVEVTPQPIADISGINMAETGADLVMNPVEVMPQPIADISEISMAEVGANVIENPKEKEKAPIPDISELNLE